MAGEMVQSEGQTFIKDIVYVLFKRRLVVSALLVVGIAIMVLGVVATPLEYEATATVLIRRLPPSYLMPAESRIVLKRPEVINSEIQIITSAAVAEIVVDKLDLASGGDRRMAIHRLQKRIKTRPPRESNVIDILYRDADPEMAALVVNTVVDAYLEVRKRVALDYEAVAFLDDQVTRLRAELDSTAQAIAEYAGESGHLLGGNRTEKHMALVQEFTRELVRLRSGIRSGEERLALVERWLESGGDMAHVPTSDIYEMSTVREAKSALVTLGAELAGARARYAPDHPEVLRLERQIAATGGLLRTEVEQAIMRQRMELDEMKAEERATREMLAILRAEDPEISEQQLRIRLFERDFSIRANLYSIVLDRREQYRITAATDPNLLNVGVVSRAAIPAKPSPDPVNMTVVTGIFTIIFGTMLVLAVERSDHSLERRDEVERYLGLKVLGSIAERTAR